MPVYASKRPDVPMDIRDDMGYSQQSTSSYNNGMTNGHPKQNGAIPNGYVQQIHSHGPGPGGKVPSGRDIYELRKHWTEGKNKAPKQRRSWANSDGPEGSLYPVEHLATFSVDRKEAVLTVEDSIRKLKLMDAKGKIWSQEMTLQITDREIVLIDNETKEFLENFPLTSIIMTTAIINECNYNSVLVFSCKDSSQKTPDMHLFQCDHVPADVISLDLQTAVDYATGKSKQKRTKKPAPRMPPGNAYPQQPHSQVAHPHQPPHDMILRPSSYDGHDDLHIPPPPREPAPNPPSGGGNVKDKVQRYNMAAQDYTPGNGSQAPPPPSVPRIAVATRQMSKNKDDDDSIEMLALRTERDVDILNHCFSDVEYFVAKLQKAADAYNELQKRKKNRKNKKKQHGDGVLQARSRPPSEDEYMDVFQKIKYAFNLLAKLKAHIHDPNAPELVHFLFTPMELIIQSCNGPELPRSVVSPLLTPQAIELLRNCLASREGEIWVSLGPAWTTPKSAWPKDQYVPPYVPKFRDGWEPPVLSSRPESAREEIEAAVAANAAAIFRAEEVRKAQKEGEERVFQFPPSQGASYGNTYYAQQQHQPQPQSATAHPATKRPPDVTGVPVQQDTSAVALFKANVNKHLDRNYEAHGLQRTKAQQAQSQPSSSLYAAHIPHQPSQHSPPTQTGRSRNAVTAKYDFVARNHKELTIMAGESLEVIDDSRMWWCVRNSSGQTGFVPSTILEPSHSSNNSNQLPSPPPQSPPPIPPGGPQASSNGDHIYHHHIQHRVVTQNDAVYATTIPKQNQPQPIMAPPPPPPPPVAPPPPTAQSSHYAQARKPNSRQHSFRTDQEQSDLQQQLKRQALRKTEIDSDRVNKRTDDLHEELKRRVNQGAKRNFQPRQRTPSVYITPDSSSEDVTRWLQTKGFSKLTVDSLGVLTGAQLFSLTKEELKQVCYEDGSRVFSQVMVQKSRLEESLNGSAELNAIMQRRKERANSSDNYDDASALHQPPPDFSPATPPGYPSSGDNSPDW